MVKIRLRRMGAKKAPFYRVVVADSRYPRDGRFIEEVGTYNPMTEPATVKLNKEAIDKWVANGAQPTDTVKAKSIVDNPDEVKVTQEINGDNVTLTLKVAESDMGMVIGKHGNIARAIRTVTKAAAKLADMKVNVEIR